MILKSNEIAKKLEEDPLEITDPFVITPVPSLDELKNSGSASVDLRLGTWFVTTKARRTSLLNIYDHKNEAPNEQSLTSKYYVPFGKSYILHPGTFVLAVTLEWLRLPSSLSGYVNGKSSWGRRGLIIETAPGVHPGFTGCLTLELANIGNIPIAIMPGTKICQIFLHEVSDKGREKDQSSFNGQRQPTLGKIVVDDFVNKLRNIQEQ